uniref:Uncharacterized protein n=1 Tax=Anguilla anguilla TaxID=7936 RepID=A0A0E9XXR9_ANGAN
MSYMQFCIVNVSSHQLMFLYCYLKFICNSFLKLTDILEYFLNCIYCQFVKIHILKQQMLFFKLHLMSMNNVAVKYEQFMQFKSLQFYFAY